MSILKNSTLTMYNHPVVSGEDVDKLIYKMELSGNMPQILGFSPRFVSDRSGIIPIQDQLGDMSDLLSDDTCGAPSSNDLQDDNRELICARLSMNKSICIDDFNKSLYTALVKSGNDASDISAIVESYFSEAYASKIQKELLTRAIFSDTTLTNTNYNKFDGFVSTIKYFIAESLPVQHSTHTFNFAQDATIVAGFQKVFDQMDFDLQAKTSEELVILTTYKLSSALRNALQRLNVDAGYTAFVNGATMRINNVQIVGLKEMDNYIAANPTQFPSSGQTANMVILTTKDNLFLGSDVDGVAFDIKTVYDAINREVAVQTQFRFGATLGSSRLVSALNIV